MYQYYQKELGLTPGTPEYLEKTEKEYQDQQNVVQPEAYITPAGYIKRCC